MSYIVKNNETITDIILNLTGDLSAWESILVLNGFTEWVPTLTDGQLIETNGVINNVTQTQLSLYPINNYSVLDLDSQISDLTDTLDAVIVEEFTQPTTEAIQTYYTVKAGETITDIVLNLTGTLDNWETILNANNFTEWVPTLTAGEQLIISYLDFQTNVVKEFETNPICNNSGIQDFDAQVNEIISNFENTILFDDELTEMLYDDELTIALYD